MFRRVQFSHWFSCQQSKKCVLWTTLPLCYGHVIWSIERERWREKKGVGGDLKWWSLRQTLRNGGSLPLWLWAYSLFKPSTLRMRLSNVSSKKCRTRQDQEICPWVFCLIRCNICEWCKKCWQNNYIVNYGCLIL